MAKIPNEIKASIIVDLDAGLQPKDIAERHHVGRATVYNIREDRKAEVLKKNKIKLSRKPDAQLETVITNMKAIAPPSAQKNLDNILDTAKSLQQLESEFHKTFTGILATANHMLTDPDITIIDWQIITTTLSNAFKDIYNASGTTINVAQGGQGENKLSMFQSRMRS